MFGVWRKSLNVDGTCYKTRSGVTWAAMNLRCLKGSYMQSKRSSYIGCSTSSAFKDFQFFTGWSELQFGYNLAGYELDKDLLTTGNKVYSEDTCIFIPKALNTFLTNHAAARGQYPIGVHFHKATGKFLSQVKVGGATQKYLGLFNSAAEAHAVYKVAKEGESRRWYERLKAGEFPVDPRVIERMRTWELPE